MSSPSIGVGVEVDQRNVTKLASSGSMESMFQNIADIKERNYMGLPNCSSVDSSIVPIMSNGNKSSLNIKATELRLGLPGSQSPERDPDHCLLSMSEFNEKPLFPLHPSVDGILPLSLKNIVSGNKRGFSDVMDGFSERKFLPKLDENARHSPNLAIKIGGVKECTGASVPVSKSKEIPSAVKGKNPNQTNSPNNNNVAPATKAQVVGWPPIRSFRKNTLATSSKASDEVDGKAGLGGLFVKVSMDGAPYLRKVDLKTYSAYQELSSSLEKMFSCFTIGQYGSHDAPGRERLSETKLKDLLRGSEFVLTYEDKDGDWMLVGDVPWEMFIGTCKRLRIMKSADAIGLAPRAMEKC